MPVVKNALDNAAMLGIRPGRLEVLENYLQKYFREDKRQAGIVKFCRYGTPVFEGFYGVSTKEYGLKPDTIFRVASITKPVISALLHILQEDGLVDLNDPVRRYLPEFEGGGREKIQVWHFLTHTSGIKEDEVYSAVDEYILKEFGLESPKDGSTHEDWQNYHRSVCQKMGLNPDAPQNDRLSDYGYVLSLKQPLLHAPRSHMTYCNYGYQRLKNIIDAVTGEPIDTFARRVLFDPLAMPDTYWMLPENKWEKVLGRNERARGYPWINSKESFQDESGAGGIKSTVNDISNFMQMVLDKGVFNSNRILSKASIIQMGMNHNAGVPGSEDAEWSSWGLGWNYKNVKKDDTGMLRSASSLDHGGWAGTKIMLDPEFNVTAALFTAEYEEPDVPPLYGPVINIFYSTLE